MNSFLIFFFTITISSGINEKFRKVLRSQMVMRHSNRTPLYVYPNSPCRLLVDEEGYGKITNEGLKLAYEYGRILKSRFVNELGLLSPKFEEIYIQSSQSERCIKTSEMIVEGIFEESNFELNILRESEKLPIKIHSLPLESDSILRSEADGCARLNELLRKRMTCGKKDEILLKHKEFLDKLSEMIGEAIVPEKIWDTYQTLLIEYYDFLHSKKCGKIPTWLTQELLDNLEKITVEILNSHYDPSTLEHEKDFPILLGGPLLSELIRNMELFKTSSDEAQKLFLYSAHDSTIYHLLFVLGIQRNAYVQYLSTLFLEIILNENNKLEVELIQYENKVKNIFTKIDLPRCPYPCYLDNFIDTHKDFISTNRHQECKNSN